MEEIIMAETKNTKDILEALLGASNDVRKTVFMKRFGIDFEIKALETDEVNKITERATRLVGKNQKKFDEELFNNLMIVKSCIIPNWEDEKLLEALEVFDAVDAVKKRLLFGEVATLLKEINELNGFDQSDDEQIEEIKN
jgi:hypothetical protein